MAFWKYSPLLDQIYGRILLWTKIVGFKQEGKTAFSCCYTAAAVCMGAVCWLGLPRVWTRMSWGKQ